MAYINVMLNQVMQFIRFNASRIVPSGREGFNASRVPNANGTEHAASERKV